MDKVNRQKEQGTKSVTARVKTRFNWNASSTIAVTQKFFSVREVADGAVSRLSLATIFLPEFAPCPVVGNYDAQFKSQLAPYIHQLNAASGSKECRKVRQLIERLGSELMELAQLAYNKPYAEFAKRSLANGFRRAMVLYLANGEKWEKAIEDFIVWKKRGFIVKNEDGTFSKTAKFIAKYGHYGTPGMAA